MPPLYIVPWFSIQEWLEVYEGAFSDDISRWKAALNAMIVWQARVDKLPSGIDVTLPLLQAKVIDADPTVEKSVKSVLLATAIQRFVSSIVKLPQTKYFQKQSMHDLATDIGLPLHLVDLRNEIIHGNGGWTGGQTVHHALETAYKWIKGYYWDAESKEMQDQSEESTPPQIPQDEWCKFKKVMTMYAATLLSDARTASKKMCLQKKACRYLVWNLESLYPHNPQEFVEAIVSHLLIPESIPDLEQRLKCAGPRGCGCFFENRVISGVDPILCSLHEMEGSTELLFTCLIKKGRENSKEASEWVRLLAAGILGRSVFYYQKTHCRNHDLNLDKNLDVNWETVVMELLETEIMSCPETGFSKSQREDVEELFQTLKGSTKEDLQQVKASKKALKDVTYTIDDVIKVAEKHSENTLTKMQKLKNSIEFLGTDITYADAPLGILPHQRDNPIFYKELLLHRPDISEDIPLPKRCRI
ncbi:Ribosomal biogenesis protein LAS1L-like [Homarus americanus]|uniref:Ribosomal biogenesis protein LAS1L-like n=1 Tax=Homarus americanus TaxID=6706 RepID=A0A8J5JZ12_HOMAM|nr:Ribosomal biogenesis protein LAS1L-like [Homarus americanus]